MLTALQPKIAHKHLAWYVVKSTLLVFIIIFGLYLFVTFFGEIDDIGKGNYTIWQAIKYSLMTMPVNIYAIIPMISLLGSLIGLGLLSTHNELTILRASGMSVMNIIAVVLKAAVVVMILAVFIGEGVGPKLATAAEANKALAESAGQAIKTQQGTWIRNGNNFIHIQNSAVGMELKGITEFQFNKQQKLVTSSYAQRAIKKKGHWYLENVATTHLTDQQTTTQFEKQKAWLVKIDTRLFSAFILDPTQMTLLSLFQYYQYQQKNHLDADRYRFVFWQRIFQPLSIIVMILLAVPFVFGSLRSVSMGLRFVTGVLIGFSFFLLNQFLEQFALIYQLSPLLSAALPLVLFSMMALFLLRRVR